MWDSKCPLSSAACLASLTRDTEPSSKDPREGRDSTEPWPDSECRRDSHGCLPLPEPSKIRIWGRPEVGGYPFLPSSLESSRRDPSRATAPTLLPSLSEASFMSRKPPASTPSRQAPPGPGCSGAQLLPSQPPWVWGLLDQSPHYQPRVGGLPGAEGGWARQCQLCAEAQ